MVIIKQVYNPVLLANTLLLNVKPNVLKALQNPLNGNNKRQKETFCAAEEMKNIRRVFPCDIF